MENSLIAVVVPCFRVRHKILDVLARIGPEVDVIVVVDDACPEQSGAHVASHCRDPRVEVVFLPENQGVGGAVLAGYYRAAEQGAAIMVKIDGDGQMDPGLIADFIAPILDEDSDYTKGNRFYDIETVKTMPIARLLGNAILSFMTKASSGYWTIFDPTNGYTAISTDAYRQLPSQKIDRRYFFETDMLFRLGTIRARVADVPMAAVYGDEQSGLKISRILGPFLAGHAANLCKRIAYTYFLRDFTIASLELVVGLLLVGFGTCFGAHAWLLSSETGVVASTGTVMLAALPIILGVQLLLSFLAYDIASTPNRAIYATSRRANRFGQIRADRVARELRALVADLERRRDAA